ncbi:terpene synthase [Bacillus sp. GBSW19]|uniref:terpene synthase n=1 Tax=unclassified Bacillus (in: firmicutes) TaxID=185979 RepID=UPI000D025EEC|nr:MULTISPECIES: terpene synthase [unclassified Bacillus (in: firmicutes)]PRS57597.1 terpene synthase [Bacillus sp. GBSW19]PRS73325.1 terpene synthase [Bacillus sp. LNXM65]
MIRLNRPLKLRDLEIFSVMKDHQILCYVIIEDTRKPFTEEDRKLDPLCYMDEEDIQAYLNVFHISIINDEKLSEEDLTMVKGFFADLVNNTNLTNFITRDYVLKNLYDVEDENDMMFFNRMLRHIGSDDVKEFDDRNWIYLSQD